MDNIEALLASLSLSEHKDKFQDATLEDLKLLDEDELKEYLRELDLPVIARSKVRKALLDMREGESTPKPVAKTSKSGSLRNLMKHTNSGKSGKDDKEHGKEHHKEHHKEHREHKEGGGRKASRVKGADGPLPPGWKELFDEKSGRTYFWNTASNEVTWKRPTEAAIVEPEEKPSSVQKYKKGAINLQSFLVKATLGTGSFGRVRLVQDVSSKQWVALKIMKKAEIVRMKQVDHIKSELNLLERVNHPFIVNLLGYFQDVHSLYLVLEYVPGGELFSLLRRRKRFNNDVSVFYAAQIVLAFEHLHKQDITYRDLKPENLLIGRDGFLKITDFGFAKIVPGDKRTYTICGTPEYLAPEIIQSRGHSTACDWWALGILIYEMLCGYPPFESESAYGIYKKVLSGQITYPKPVNESAKDLLSKLLHPKPAYRLGNLKNGAEDIKTHAWFKDLDWRALEERRLRAPYIPKVKSEYDTSNFPKYNEGDDQPGQPVEEDLFPEFGKF